MDRRALGGAALLLAALAAGSAGCAAPSPRPVRPGGAAAHPEIAEGPNDTCGACHSTASPDVVAAWRAGPHGISLVDCFVCHGAVRGDFRHRPEPGSCAACHPAQVRSVAGADGGEVRDCFACHPPHALRPATGPSPHGVPRGGQP